MVPPYWWFKNKTLKMLGAVGGLFLVSFYLYCDLQNPRWVEKGVFIFQRSSSVRSIEPIETIDSLLHYCNCYQCFLFIIRDWKKRMKNYTVWLVTKASEIWRPEQKFPIFNFLGTHSLPLKFKRNTWIEWIIKLLLED